MIYLLLANSALILFYLLYRFAFKRLTFFQWNRIYLLLSVVLSFGIPLSLFIQYEVPKMVVIRLPELVLGLNNAKNINPIDQPNSLQNGEIEQTSTIQIDSLINGLYWVGVIAMTIWFIYRLILLIKLINNKEGKSNYSFFNKVVVHPKLEEQEMIHQHELIHVRQGHSFDIMLLEIIRIFNWFNPVVYLIIKELKFQHECIVDQQFDHNKVAYAELLVAQAVKVHPSLISHAFSNQSILKDRITMLFKNKSKLHTKIYYLSILPISVLILSVTVACRSNAQENKTKIDESKKESLGSSNKPKEVYSKENPKPMAKDEEIIRFPEPKVVVAKEVVAQKRTKEEGTIRFPEPKVVSGKKAGAQTVKLTMKNPQDGVMDYNKVEIPAEYPGGLKQFRHEVQSNIMYPKEAIDQGVKGTVEVSFVIGIDGIPTDFKVIKDLNGLIGDNAIKTIKKAKAWLPAVHNGKKVPVRFLLPIRFDLSQK